MFTFTDANVLTSSQLNGNFADCLDKETSTPQTVTAATTFSAAVTLPALNVSGTVTYTGAEIDNVVTLTGAGNYVCLSSDRFVVVKKTSPQVTTITLPTGVIGRLLSIKDAAGNAASFNITLMPAGSDTIDGASSITMTTNYQHMNLL